MPPRSPLPRRHGLDAAWLRTPDPSAEEDQPWLTMADWLTERLSQFIDVDAFLAAERIVYESGLSVSRGDAYRPCTFVFFHRDLPDEAPVPGGIHVVHHDDRLVVVDKPAFLSTIPRGRHVLQSVVVRMREELGLPDLSPLHRLDRVTSGLVIMATERRWRGDYQMLFQRGEVGKTYHALATARAGFAPVTVRNHLTTVRGQWQSQVVPEAPANAESRIELEHLLGDEAVYRLTPRTGRTHQLRMHMLGLGLPISGDPLYPHVLDVALDDFSTPLQLVASEVRFTDPISGAARHFASVRRLPLVSEVSEVSEVTERS